MYPESYLSDIKSERISATGVYWPRQQHPWARVPYVCTTCPLIFRSLLVGDSRSRGVFASSTGDPASLKFTVPGVASNGGVRTGMGTAATAGVSATDQRGSMLVQGLFTRAAGRASESDRDWYPLDDGVGFGRDIPEGTLWLRPSGERWVVVWCMSTTEGRPIAIGSRGEVEQDTREFILFGLPGGAEPFGRPWRFAEGSLHHPAGDGSFRLMMLQRGERGGLVFVRHDATVYFLGADRVDALIRSADARLANLGPPLHAWFAGRRVPLRGVGVIGVIGQAELARDVRIVLVQVDHDHYELHIATIGDAYGLLGVYTSADLQRGDLGAILVAGPVQQSASRMTDRTPPSIEPPTPPQVESPAPPLTKVRREPRACDPRPCPRPGRPAAPQPPAAPASFTEEDRQRLDTCLTPRQKEYTGAGASVMPLLYEGFRLIMEDALKCRADALREYGGPLRARAIRDVIEEKRKAPIPGGERTFTRGLLRFLAETGLGERVGRRVQLHLGDWQRVITMLRANYAPTAPTTGRASLPAPSRRDSPPAAASSTMPSSSRADAWTSAPPTTSPPPPTSMGEPPVGDLGEPPVGDLPQPRHDPGLVEPVVGGWRRTLRKDGRPTYYERLYDRTDDDSPSRFQGVPPKPRGSPDS